MTNQVNRTAPRFVPAILSLGAMKAHETRAALRILNGDTSDEAITKYVELASQANDFQRVVHG